MKPIILVSGSIEQNAGENPAYKIKEYYPKMLCRAGAQPVLSLYGDEEEYAEMADGLLLAGGDDIDPSYFGEPVLNETVAINRSRDEHEIKLIKAFVKRGKPVFGICRGIQVLNVAFGGSLWQDLWTQKQTNHSNSVHEVRALRGSMLDRIFGKRFPVNSFHHQAVKELGEGLVAIAMTDDIIEAVAHQKLPVFGVQWHPERMTGDGNLPDMTSLFEFFISLIGGNGKHGGFFL